MITDIKEMLTRHEERRNKPYRDSEGILSIGIGRNLEANGLSDFEIDFLFANDLAATKLFVCRNISCYKDLTPNRQNVILDMAFNLRSRLLLFKDFLAHLQAGEYDKAADAMIDSKWAQQVHTRALELADLMREG